MTKNYILAIGTNHPRPELLRTHAARLFTDAGFALTVLTGVKLSTALEFEKEAQIYSNGEFVLWARGSGIELEMPAALLMRAEEKWKTGQC